MTGWLLRALSIGQSAPLAVASLVVANLIPLVGVLFFGWDVAMILIAYWLENGIVGLFNVAKILLAQGPSTQGVRARGSLAGEGSGNSVIAVFFAVHYGFFWLIHGVFVVLLTGRGGSPDLTDPFRLIFSEPPILVAALALVASHAASFWLNYLGRGEYRTASAASQMWQPYPRMVGLHVGIVVGGALLIGADEPVLFTALLVVLKTMVDLFLHLREHRRAQLPRVAV